MSDMDTSGPVGHDAGIIDTDGTIIWIGGAVTNGGGATSPGMTMSKLASLKLAMTPILHASDDATWANGIPALADAAVHDGSVPASDVRLVCLCGGLSDVVADLAVIITHVRQAISTVSRAWPNARIAVGIGPGSIVGWDDERIADNTNVLAAIRGEARARGALCINLRSVCGADPDLQASGILPNDAGHERLADAICAAIIEDRGEPLDTPVTDLTRRYNSGGDWLGRQVQSVQRREAEKREANRPTGTELGGVTQKLNEVTQQQGVQQVLLDQQQEALEQHQKKLEKQQNQLEQQQTAIKAAHDQLAKQQEQLTAIVGDQGTTINNVKALTERIDAQQKQISSQAQQLIDMENWRTGALLQTLADYEARISALESR